MGQISGLNHALSFGILNPYLLALTYESEFNSKAVFNTPACAICFCLSAFMNVQYHVN